MARARGFDEADAVRAAAELFTRHGYEGTSVDDLVNQRWILEEDRAALLRRGEQEWSAATQ